MIEPSDYERAAWPEATAQYVVDLEAEVERLTAELAQCRRDYQTYVDGVRTAEEAEIDSLRNALNQQRELWQMAALILDRLDDTDGRKRFTELHDPLGKIDSALKEAD